MTTSYEMSSRQKSLLVATHRLQSLWVFAFALAVFGMVCIADEPSEADSLNPLFDVSGTMAITGNNVCTPSPCTETINFSFQYGYSYNPSMGL